MNMSVLERQREARWKWEQEDDCYLTTDLNGVFSGGDHSVLAGAGAMVDSTPYPGPDYGWSDFGRVDDQFPLLGFHGNDMMMVMMNHLGSISRTLSCPPAVANAATPSLKRGDAVASEKMSANTGFKRRKADCLGVQNETQKTRKGFGGGGAKGESKITEEKNGNNMSSSSNKNSKSSNKNEMSSSSGILSKGSSEVEKPDFIHVRARRGQATDSHSLAERVRREKISERMKFLQDLVPGCNKITGKAGMLDEIINYVQSLQQQVEFLSMKLAAVNSRPDFDTVTDFSAKQMFPPPAAEFQTLLPNPEYPQHSQMQEAFSRSEVEVGIRPPHLGLRRSISAPIPFPNTFFEQSCFAIQSSALWDAELQNTIYNVAFDQGKSTPSSSLPFTGLTEANNLKSAI